jgi:hypothetical protein
MYCWSNRRAAAALKRVKNPGSVKHEYILRGDKKAVKIATQ